MTSGVTQIISDMSRKTSPDRKTQRNRLLSKEQLVLPVEYNLARGYRLHTKNSKNPVQILTSDNPPQILMSVLVPAFWEQLFLLNIQHVSIMLHAPAGGGGAVSGKVPL